MDTVLPLSVCNMLLYYTTQDSFETVVNRRQNKPAELVGKPLKRREGGRGEDLQ